MTLTLDKVLTEKALVRWSDQTVNRALRPTADEALTAGERVHIVEVVADGLTRGTDYELGDNVTAILSTGEAVQGRVSEVVESWDASGYKSTPSITRI